MASGVEYAVKAAKRRLQSQKVHTMVTGTPASYVLRVTNLTRERRQRSRSRGEALQGSAVMFNAHTVHLSDGLYVVRAMMVYNGRRQRYVIRFSFKRVDATFCCQLELRAPETIVARASRCRQRAWQDIDGRQREDIIYTRSTCCRAGSSENKRKTTRQKSATTTKYRHDDE